MITQSKEKYVGVKRKAHFSLLRRGE